MYRYADMISARNIVQEFPFAAETEANNNNVGFSVRVHGSDTTSDYRCSVENITMTVFQINSNDYAYPGPTLKGPDILFLCRQTLGMRRKFFYLYLNPMFLLCF